MDWIKSIQNAINYVEENLTEEIDYSEVAKRANSSTYHFQRIFGMLCGYPLGEYIRNRRLSLAGNELATTTTKVIDVALKYGYDSPESFSRAFVRFHGITPSSIKNGGSLKSFSKLSVKLILDGGSTMDYQIIKKEAFKIVSRKKMFSTNMEETKKQIPSFWCECQKDGSIEGLCKVLDKKVLGNVVIGVCFEEQGDSKEFPYGIGVAYDGGTFDNKNFVEEEVPSLTWVKFNCKGAMPEAIHSLLHKVYSEFFPSSDYKPANGYFLELYPEGDVNDPNFECEIWISVDKK